MLHLEEIHCGCHLRGHHFQKVIVCVCLFVQDRAALQSRSSLEPLLRQLQRVAVSDDYQTTWQFVVAPSQAFRPAAIFLQLSDTNYDRKIIIYRSASHLFLNNFKTADSPFIKDFFENHNLLGVEVLSSSFALLIYRRAQDYLGFSSPSHFSQFHLKNLLFFRKKIG